MYYTVDMRLEWNADKNELLKRTRNVCFEQVQEKIEAGDFKGLEVNSAKKNQMRIIIKLNGYPYVVPFVITENGGWFLKTMYPCRNMKGRI